MHPIKAKWTNGQIVPAEPVDWPEGIELLVEPVASPDRVGLSEADFCDDAAALADWEAWIRTIEPLEFTEEERAELDRYREKFRQFNIEAVRKQMGLGGKE